MCCSLRLRLAVRLEFGRRYSEINLNCTHLLLQCVPESLVVDQNFVLAGAERLVDVAQVFPFKLGGVQDAQDVIDLNHGYDTVHIGVYLSAHPPEVLQLVLLQKDGHELCHCELLGILKRLPPMSLPRIATLVFHAVRYRPNLQVFVRFALLYGNIYVEEPANPDPLPIAFLHAREGVNQIV